MKVAFIGLGTMGEFMALNILKAGHELTVHNRTRTREESLATAGAKRAGSPMEAARGAEIIVTCVSDTPDVEKVLLGDEGIIRGADPGSVYIDTSTIDAEAARRFGDALAEKGIMMIDAPVSGGSEGARLGTLSIMMGGAPEAVAKARPVLEAMGKTITHVGPLGSGQLTKAINQVIVGGTYLAVAEGLVLGLKAGLDMEKVVQAVSSGAAASWVLDKRAGHMIDNNYPLGFRVRLHRKDLFIALKNAGELEVSLPLASLVAQLENGLLARGFGDEDLSALARSLRELSGLEG